MHSNIYGGLVIMAILEATENIADYKYQTSPPRTVPTALHEVTHKKKNIAS